MCLNELFKPSHLQVDEQELVQQAVISNVLQLKQIINCIQFTATPTAISSCSRAASLVNEAEETRFQQTDTPSYGTYAHAPTHSGTFKGFSRRS